jgi:hypothetical protein
MPFLRRVYTEEAHEAFIYYFLLPPFLKPGPANRILFDISKVLAYQVHHCQHGYQFEDV